MTDANNNIKSNNISKWHFTTGGTADGTADAKVYKNISCQSTNTGTLWIENIYAAKRTKNDWLSYGKKSTILNKWEAAANVNIGTNMDRTQ